MFDVQVYHFVKVESHNFYVQFVVLFVNLRIFLNFLAFRLQAIIDDIKDNKPHKDIITEVKELSVKNIIPEHEVISIVSLLRRETFESFKF